MVVEHYLAEFGAGCVTTETKEALVEALGSIQAPEKAPATAAAADTAGAIDSLKSTLPVIVRLVVVDDVQVRVCVQRAMEIIFSAVL
jgi:hypothetical protein